MTARRISFAVLFILFFLLAAFTGDRIYLFFLYTLAGAFVFSLADFISVCLSLKVTQKVIPSPVQKWTGCRLVIQVKNRSILPVSSAYLTFGTVEACFGMPFTGAFLCLGPRAVREIGFEMECPLCGSFRVGLVSAVVSDLFGLFRMKLSPKAMGAAEALELTVLPRVIPILDTLMTPPEEKAGETAGLFSDVEPSPDVRRFEPGDPQKRIHWKLSARNMELFTRIFENSTEYSSRFYIDCTAHGLSGLQAYIYEDAVCEASVSVALWLLGQGKTRLTVNSPHLAVLDGDGIESFDYFLAALSRLPFGGSIPLVSLIRAELSDISSHVAVVVRQPDKELISLLADLCGTGRPVSLFIAGEPDDNISGDIAALETAGALIVTLPQTDEETEAVVNG